MTADNPRRPQPDPLAPDELRPTADVLGRALTDKAADVEPGADAYARLATRVAASSRRRPTIPWSSGRLAVAATAGLALVATAIGITALNAGDDDPTGQAVVVTAVEDATTNVEETVDVPSVPSGIEQIPATPDTVSDLSLARPTRSEAIDAFVDLLAIDFVEHEVDDDVATLWTFFEGSSERQPTPLATLELTPVTLDEGDGWIVTQATSADVEIDEPHPGAQLTGQDDLVVSGRGSGFEAWVDIELRSATDGSVLYGGGTSAGNQIAPFETTVPLVGTERAWLVVRSAGAADGVASSFAAMPISFEGTVDRSDYIVVRIGADDPDGGLVLRSGPGTTNERITVVPAGDSVGRRPGVYPTRNGSTVWWPVAFGGNEGWVASSYLAGPRPATVADSDYADAAQRFLEAAARPESASPFLVPAARAGFTLFHDQNRLTVGSGDVTDPAFWASDRSELGGRSPSELLAVPEVVTDVEILIDQPAFVDGANQAVADGYFGGVTTVTAAYAGSDGEGRHLHLFFTTRPDGRLAVLGALIEIGTPSGSQQD